MVHCLEKYAYRKASTIKAHWCIIKHHLYVLRCHWDLYLKAYHSTQDEENISGFSCCDLKIQKCFLNFLIYSKVKLHSILKSASSRTTPEAPNYVKDWAWYGVVLYRVLQHLGHLAESLAHDKLVIEASSKDKLRLWGLYWHKSQ